MNVQEFAVQHGLAATLLRALSFHPTIGPRLLAVPVEYNPNLTTAAGQFTTRGGPPRISLHLALPNEAPGELAATFLHEVAHAMQWFVYSEVNHSASWWEMMHQLGQRPTRLHTMNLRARSTRAPGGADDMGL